jgi:hypothetical protein
MSQKINVDIITEYKGGQHIKKAEGDLGGLKSAFNKLAGAAAAAFSVQKITEFGKAAVEAFAADEKSAKILSNTLGNLGLAFSNVPVENFISKLSELNGIAKTDLRNAFDTLVRSTGDASKAQDLLNLGLDVSAGTGKDLSLVTVALAKAYGGNFAAISKLGAGITKAEIKTGDFAEIQKHLASVFKGDAATAAETFSGKIARLKTSFEEFKITIGSGIVDAFSNLTANGDVQGFQDAMGAVAKDIADIVRGLGVVGGKITGILSSLNGFSGGGLGKALSADFFPITSLLGQLGKLGAASKKATEDAANAARMKIPQGPFAEGYTSLVDHAKYVAAQKKLADDKAKALKAELDAQKKITDQKNKQMALDRAALSLKLAGNTTDMQNIEIQAALQRGQSADVTNVLLLQRAILTGNADQANILSQEVLKANGLVMDVNGNISTLAKAKDPFADWPPASKAAMDQLKAIQDALAAIKDKKITITVDTVSTSNGSSTEKSSASSTATNPYTYLPEVSKGAMGLQVPGAPIKSSILVPGGSSSATDLAYAALSANQMPGYNPAMELALNGNRGGSSTPIAVTVHLNGKEVGNAITDAQVDQSASGVANSFQRSGYGSGALPW